MRFRAYLSALLALLVFGAVSPASAQGIKRILVSRARVFSEFGPGIAEMKRDASGNYYVLAKPATVIWIVGSRGQRLGQIPQANSAAAAIQYAVDFDIDPSGRILVADRGANAIEIFQPDGTFVTKVQVFAPTSVVALSDGEFAVSTLRTKRLVLILNDKGTQIRSFGDPVDMGVDVYATPLESLGRISGDSANDVYFAFITLANPTIRKFDRFGYAHGDAMVTADQLHYTPPGHEDRVQFGFNMSEMNFSSTLDGGAMVGSSGDIHFRVAWNRAGRAHWRRKRPGDQRRIIRNSSLVWNGRIAEWRIWARFRRRERRRDVDGASDDSRRQRQLQSGLGRFGEALDQV